MFVRYPEHVYSCDKINTLADNCLASSGENAMLLLPFLKWEEKHTKKREKLLKDSSFV